MEMRDFIASFECIGKGGGGPPSRKKRIDELIVPFERLGRGGRPFHPFSKTPKSAKKGAGTSVRQIGVFFPREVSARTGGGGPFFSGF